MEYIWENPHIIGENKEPGHALLLPYDSEQAASDRGATPYKLSLNGT